MVTTHPNPNHSPGRGGTLFCAAACDLNHAAVPHPPWDCNASDDAPTLTAAQRTTIPDGELPWVRYATPLVLSAGELEWLRSPIGSALHALEVDEIDRDTPEADRLSPRLEAVDHRLIRASLDAQRASPRLDVPARFSCPDANQLRQVMSEAAGRLDDLIRRRDAETPGYLVGSKFFGKATQGLRDWSLATASRRSAPACSSPTAAGSTCAKRPTTAARPSSRPCGSGRPDGEAVVSAEALSPTSREVPSSSLNASWEL
jgi:hypothetical protein